MLSARVSHKSATTSLSSLWGFYALRQHVASIEQPWSNLRLRVREAAKKKKYNTDKASRLPGSKTFTVFCHRWLGSDDENVVGSAVDFEERRQVLLSLNRVLISPALVDG